MAEECYLIHAQIIGNTPPWTAGSIELKSGCWYMQTRLFRQLRYNARNKAKSEKKLVGMEDIGKSEG